MSGVHLRTTEPLLMVVLSLSILATLQIIGVTLVAATLVIPAVVARMSSDSFSRGCSGSRPCWARRPASPACTCPGHLEVPSGTTIVLVNALAFVVVLAVTGGRTLRRAAGLDDHAAAPAPVLAGR